jgi:tight adherence protein B
MILFLLIILLITAAVILLSMAIFPTMIEGADKWRQKKEKFVEKELDKMFYDKSPKRIMQLYFILPPVLAGAALLLLQSGILAAVGAVLGLVVPNVILRTRNRMRKQKFEHQILDAIMILSSSLKGGLSLLQALEVLVEEMPVPMNQEIGLVVRENRMGVSLEESLRHLDKRVDSDDLRLVINSILVARETGGDLTKVLSRLSTTIRDNRKLKESIRTLTLQGRMQGIIMSVLPFLFIWWVVSFNRQHFDIMLQSDTGRMLLFVAIALQVIGMILIRKFSKITF